VSVYLLALRPTGTGLLPPPWLVVFMDLPEEKCQEKESRRKQVLASMVPSAGTDTNWIKDLLQEKSKQSAVTTMMQQVHKTIPN
jgi:hypothetical protein